MNKCNECGGDKYYSRTNYPFGRNSKGRTIVRCLKCGNIIPKTRSK